MMRRLFTVGMLAACALPLWGDQAKGGFRHVDAGDGGGGTYINIIVREIRIAPVRAHVGDVIRVDMVV